MGLLRSPPRATQEDQKPVLTAAILCLAAALLAIPAEAQIKRDRAQVRAFRAEHPCPATGLKRGACPGWHVDHIIECDS